MQESKSRRRSKSDSAEGQDEAQAGSDVMAEVGESELIGDREHIAGVPVNTKMKRLVDWET